MEREHSLDGRITVYSPVVILCKRELFTGNMQNHLGGSVVRIVPGRTMCDTSGILFSAHLHLDTFLNSR